MHKHLRTHACTSSTPSTTDSPRRVATAYTRIRDPQTTHSGRAVRVIFKKFLLQNTKLDVPLKLAIFENLHNFIFSRFLPDINRPRPPGWGMLNFGWVKTVIAYTEEEVLQVAGWDAVVYLRILRFGAHAPDRGPPRAC